MKRKRRRKLGIDFTTLTPVEVYELLVSRTILTFPNAYVVPENMKPILREVFLNRLKLTREEICKNINDEYLMQYSLGGARKAFNQSIYQMINYCFPEMNIKPWELNRIQNGFWTQKQNQKEFMEWLVKKEKINVKSIQSLRRIDAKLIQKYGGSKPLVYSGGLYQLILLVVKIDIKEWQATKMREWKEEKAIEAIKWLIEEKLKWSDEEIENKLSIKVFNDNYLGGMLKNVCNNSPSKALQVAYPNKQYKLKNVQPEYLRKK